ncbi:hypothetical protein HYX70_02410 [Candidatus Saccharibacteria bacterium]|nr:hypothetical protein [Candidatus Saccharibacteria bacterium]
MKKTLLLVGASVVIMTGGVAAASSSLDANTDIAKVFLFKILPKKIVDDDDRWPELKEAVDALSPLIIGLYDVYMNEFDKYHLAT